MEETTRNKNSLSLFLLNGKYRVYRHLLLQAVILLITVGIFFDTPDKVNLSLNRFYGWISYFLFMNMLVYFNAYVLCPRFLLKKKFSIYIFSIIIFTVFVLLIMVVLQEYFYDIAVIHQEPSTVAIVFSILSSFFAILLFLAGISALVLFKHWLNDTIRASELESANLNTELTFLKSQINPHFLFNMLNNANILVEDEPDMASHILIKLNDLLSYQTNEATHDKVFLNEDIAFLRDFLDLEKTRRDYFEYTLSIEGNTDKVEVASLLFIPFVENAVKHNVDSEGLSYVYLSFKVGEDKLKFTCENSIPQKEKTPHKKKWRVGIAQY